MSDKVTYAIVRIDSRDTKRHADHILDDVMNADPSIRIISTRTVKEDDSWVDQPVLYWP